MKLNLAAGDRPKEGYINVDREKLSGIDQVVNLEQYPWPWEDNSVQEIHVSHYLEHTKDIIKFMEECYRILQHSGLMYIAAPFERSSRAWADPSHVRSINELFPLYYSKEWREKQKLGHYNIKTNFFPETVAYVRDPEFEGMDAQDRKFAEKHFWNVILDIHFTLRKKSMIDLVRP